MSITMKMYDVVQDEQLMGAGGYIMGEGSLPPGFNPNEFMKRFSMNIIRRAMRNDAEALRQINEELGNIITQEEAQAIVDEKIAGLGVAVNEGIDEAPVVEYNGPAISTEEELLALAQ